MKKCGFMKYIVKNYNDRIFLYVIVLEKVQKIEILDSFCHITEL